MQEISEKFSNKAAQSVQRLNELKITRETQAFEEKIELIDKEIEGKKKNWDQEKYLMNNRINELESMLKKKEENEKSHKNKISELESDKKNLKEKINKLSEKKKEQKEEFERKAKEMEIKIQSHGELNKVHNSQKIMELEKNCALLSQEINFIKKEKESILEMNMNFKRRKYKIKS